MTDTTNTENKRLLELDLAGAFHAIGLLQETLGALTKSVRELAPKSDASIEVARANWLASQCGASIGMAIDCVGVDPTE
jgi:hypothetical protein